ncbi:cobalt ECF transporter T component CbiQ [Clostridium sp. HBUAS56017]|uniref:cobalt ECF transporter T component CbiQ n=1 Tax=Clostridium sp. HBUAS56017 TaxID=2571128 RepID=UPI00117750B3|nr:cobalt ECF transporter T component CbiQ [Clostridium sp. HBUAS56017]
MITIDKLAYNSNLRHKDPSLKSFFAISILLICVIARSNIISLVTLVLMGAITLLYNNISLTYYLKLLTVPFLFLLLSSVAIIFNITTYPLDLFSLEFGSHYLAISSNSLFFTINLILTAISSISCLYLLTLTTPFTDLLSVFKKIHCPFIIIELMLLIYRYIFVLLDIALTIQTSQKSRLGNKNFKTSLYSMSQMLSVLLIRSFKKASTLYDSMESRCYNGEIHVLNETYEICTKDILVVILIEVFILALAILV